MAAENLDITDSNQPDIGSQLQHVITDLHQVLQTLRDQGVIQARHDRLLREFEPLLAQFRSPAAAYMMTRRPKWRTGASQDRPEGQ